VGVEHGLAEDGHAQTGEGIDPAGEVGGHTRHKKNDISIVPPLAGYVRAGVTSQWGRF
jgi:hypothetical protein